MVGASPRSGRFITDLGRKFCAYLLYIKRQDREIVFRFSVAELRISAETIGLCDKLIEAFSEIEFQRISRCEALCAVVAFAVLSRRFTNFSPGQCQRHFDLLRPS